MSTATPPPSSPLPWARRVVFWTFVGLVAYVGLAIIISIAADLYGQLPSAGETGASNVSLRSSCARRLSGLRQELERQLTFELDHPRLDNDPLRRYRAWRETWGRQLDLVEEHCGDDATIDQLTRKLTDLDATLGQGLSLIVETRAGPSLELERNLRDVH